MHAHKGFGFRCRCWWRLFPVELQLPPLRWFQARRRQRPGAYPSSIAVSDNSIDRLLINASPDVLTQIRATPELQPARALAP
jgi:hypothetical protein